MKVLVVGLAVVDFVFDVQTMPVAAEKYVACDAQMVGGGGAANAACAIARLGGDAMLAARVGDDQFGTAIVDELVAQGVDCSLVQITHGARSAYSSVLVDQFGERQIVNFRGRNLSDEVALFSSLSVDAVLADTRWVNGTNAALTLARQLGVPGVLDAEAPVCPESLQLATHVTFSKQGLTSTTGIENLHSALPQVQNQCAGFVCVTDGEAGAYYLDDNTVKNVPAFEVDVKDTLGAGDVWHGVFTYMIASGEDEPGAMRYANAAASVKCARKGGGRNAPTLVEISAFLKAIGE